VAQDIKQNPLALRFLFKNKAVSDSKSVKEVVGDVQEAQITVMTMKIAPSVKQEEMVVDHDEFWAEILRVVMEKYQGTQDKDDVFAALKKGYEDKYNQ
jgi:hypothetical protein